MSAARALTASQNEWLRVRSYLQEHRYDLALDAAGDYPAERRIAGTPLLAAPGWQPAEPVPLQDIGLEFTAREVTAREVTAREVTARAEAHPAPGDGVAPLLPERPDGTRYLRYSDAMRELAAPAVFENRPTYRLTEADLGASRLAFTRGRYFDGVDTGEAAAHEYAAARLGGSSHHRPAGLRALVADPCDLRRRPANLAISTLTLRFDAATGRASFLLHWRDPAKVGHAGGMYQVIPVGVFQPAGPEHERGDFSLWRCMIREFDEELRGRTEDYGPGPVDYDAWPFARHMAAALDAGQIRVWCLGLGVDPLTYATDLLTVAVIDSRVFDELFSLSPRRNAEGRVLAAREFAAHVIDRIVTGEPVQAAGAAVLRLAWRHRETLTG
jgi:hypothetical protein